MRCPQRSCCFEYISCPTRRLEGGGNRSGNSGSDTDRSWAKLSSWNSLQQRAVAQANHGHDLHHPTRLLRGNDCQSNLSDSKVEISVDGAEVKECGQAMTLACLIHMSSFILLLNTRGAVSNVSNGRVFWSEFLPGHTYLEPSWRRLVMFHGPSDECDLVGQRHNVQAFLERVNTTYIIIDKSRMQRLIGLCSRISADLNIEAQNLVPQGALDPPFLLDRREDRFGGEESNFVSNPPSTPSLKGPKQQSKSIWSLDLLKNILILPGTKWCGAGDIAEHYNDLGYYGDVDKCCRSHDLCLTILGEYLAPGQCRNGLCNFSPVTRSPCRCDREFVSCLRSVKTRLSNALGRVFFNIAGMTCYKYEHPVKRCAEYVDPPKNNLPPWILSATKIRQHPKQPRCKEYELDTSKPKAWQFFDTFFEETNHRSTERRRRRPDSPFEMFQHLFLNLFYRIVDPI